MKSLLFYTITGRIAIACVVIFTMQIYYGMAFTEALMFEPMIPYTYITPSLLHGSLLHIVLNIVAFIAIGSYVEELYGKKTYVVFLLLTAIISNAAQGFIVDYRFVGISGVVFGLCAACMLEYHFKKRYKIPTNSIWTLSMTIQVLGWLGLGFIFNAYLSSSVGVGIATMAHLYGFLAGGIFMMVLLNMEYPLKRLKQRE